MKVVAPLLALTSVASAHYNFDALIYNGVAQAQWSHVRMRTDHDSHEPVTNVSSLALRCGLDAPPAPNILTVTAGSTLGFNVDPSIQHPGPLSFYLAKVPAGQTAKTWDGSGFVWYKVAAVGATFGPGTISWATEGLKTVNFTIPKSTPNGDFLVRVEHIGLHAASVVGGAQFYQSCGQITVTGGGSANPPTKVAIPGAVGAEDPGVLINIYWPVPTSYVIPGPAVFTG